MSGTHEEKSKAELIDEIRRLNSRIDGLERQLAPDTDPLSASPTHRYIVENLPFYLAWKDRDLVYQGCNRNMARLAGLGDPSEIVGKTDFDLTSTREEAKLFRTGDQGVIESGRQLVNREATYHCADGSVLDIVTSKCPLRDADGQIVGVISVFADNSESKRAVRLMQEAQERNRLILEMVPAVIAYFDSEQRFRFHNARNKTFRDFPRDELVGRTIREGLGDETYFRGLPYIKRALVGEPQCFEIAIDMENVKASEVLVSFVPDTDSNGVVRGVYLLATDITERKAAERALRESEARLQAIVEYAPVEIYMKDREGRHLCSGRESRRKFGRNIKGALAHEFMSEEFADPLTAQDRYVLETGAVVPQEYRLPLADGWHDFVSIKFPVPSGIRGDTIVGGVSIDVTEQKRNEGALREARDKAEHANLAKSRFLAAASHDLRQPLQALRLLIAVLESTSDPIERREIVNDMTSSVEAMGELLDALLDIGKLEAGSISPEIVDTPVNSLLDRVAVDFRAEAARKGLVLRIVPSSATIATDPTLMGRILGNLVSNAIRYTESGTVLVGCRQTQGRLRIQVLDTGIGIRAEEHSQIFEEYHQIDNPARDRAKGLGLGLSIVERLAALLDHKISLHSIPGKGSVFSIETPIVRTVATVTEQQQPAEASAWGMAQRRVLIVEDDESVANAMRRMLARWGADVQLASTHESAVAKATTDDEAPDLIISDYRLPGNRTGVDTLAEIDHRLNRSVPGIIITGQVMPADLKSAEEAGYPVLSKPVDPSAMRALVRQLTGKPNAAAGTRKRD